MKRTLEQFAAECRDILTADPGEQGREQVASLLEEVLKDEEFVNTYVGETTSDRQLLYEDPDLGFAILAHYYQGASIGNPHDHGSTWAIYGQATGMTEMTEWDIVEPATREKAGLAKVSTVYNLEPGQARAYRVGQIHSPRREDSTRLIRIEGQNMDRLERFAYKAVE